MLQVEENDGVGADSFYATTSDLLPIYWDSNSDFALTAQNPVEDGAARYPSFVPSLFSKTSLVCRWQSGASTANNEIIVR
jgi:hypothetical protein